jgi:hypothetical protein
MPSLSWSLAFTLLLADVLLLPVSDGLLLSDGLAVGVTLALLLTLLLADVLLLPVSDGLTLALALTRRRCSQTACAHPPAACGHKP